MLFEVDGVENFDAVRLIDDLPASVPHWLSVLIQLGGTPAQHGSHLVQKLPFGIGDYIAAVHLHKGRFDKEPGLTAAANDQDSFVPGVLVFFGWLDIVRFSVWGKGMFQSGTGST